MKVQYSSQESVIDTDCICHGITCHRENQSNVSLTFSEKGHHRIRIGGNLPEDGFEPVPRSNGPTGLPRARLRVVRIDDVTTFGRVPVFRSGFESDRPVRAGNIGRAQVRADLLDGVQV